VLGRQGLLVVECDDHIDLEPDEFRSQHGEPIGFARCVPGFKDEVLALDPAEILQRREKRNSSNII
jgi:hypothetical protein